MSAMHVPDFILRYLLVPTVFVLLAPGMSQGAAPMPVAVLGTPVVAAIAVPGNDCTLTLDQAGRVNLGRVPVAALTRAGSLPGHGQMPTRSIMLSGSCRTARAFTLRFSLPAVDEASFRLGDRARLRLSLGDAVIDGQPASLAQGGTGARANGVNGAADLSRATSGTSSAITLRPGQDVMIVPTGARAQGRMFSVRIHLDGQVPLDGARSLIQLAADARIELL